MSAVLLLVVALAATLESSPTTGRLPDRKNEICVQAWQAYTQELLKKIFPEDRDRISKVQVIIVEDGELNAYAYYDPEAVRVHSGMLRFVRDEAEYAFMMAHEVQHILNRHDRLRHAGGWFGVGVDFALLRRKEITADILAVDAMRRAGIDVCGSTRIMARLGRHYRVNENPEDPLNKIGLRRMRIVKYFCSRQP